MESNYKEKIRSKGWMTEEYRNYTHYKLVARKGDAEFSHLTDSICFETYQEKEKEFNRTWKCIYDQICRSSSDDSTEITVRLSRDSLAILDRWANDEGVSRSEYLDYLLSNADSLEFLYSDLIVPEECGVDYKKKLEDFGLSCKVEENEFSYTLVARSKDNMWGGSHCFSKRSVELSRCSLEHAFGMGWKEVYMDIVRYFGRIF